MHETRAWNIPHYKRLHNCLLTSLGSEYLAKTSYIGFDVNDDHYDPRLESHESCSAAELNVVIGGTFHFGASQFGRVSGEDIWARSTIDAYKALGYTFLYAFEIIESMEINLEIPSLVKLVIAESGHIRDCATWGIPGLEKKLTADEVARGAKVVKWRVEDLTSRKVEFIQDANEVEKIDKAKFAVTPMGYQRMYGQTLSSKSGRLDKSSPDYEPHENWRCVKSQGFEEGLPIWKMFAWHFWESPSHPVGGQHLELGAKGY